MRLIAACWIVGCLGVVVGGEVVEKPRPVVRHEARIDAEPATWIAVGYRVAAYGTGNRIAVADTVPRFVVRERRTVSAEIVTAAVAGDRLYAVLRTESGQRLATLDLTDPLAEPASLELHPEPSGMLHVAQMDDYLVVAEDGHGVRVLALPAHDHEGAEHHHGHGTSSEVGFLPMAGPFEALAVARRAIVASTPGGVTVINGSIPSMPVVSAEFPLQARIDSMAANGDVALLLGDTGLLRLDLTTGAVEAIDPSRRGGGVHWSGRTIYVATDDGLDALRDVSAQGATFVVQVGDSFFNPAGTIDIEVGDTVQWQKPVTNLFHNVFSCTAAQTGCGGIAATESFSSGTVTTASFNFQHTFQLEGNNPYVCQVHTLSMRGDIRVTAVAATPPGVPDGTGVTTPMTAGKQNAAGTELELSFDTGCPDAVDHDVIGGRAVDLPMTPGGVYSPTVFRCAIGTVSPFTWTASPTPASGDFIWWVIVADDGSTTEGSWGKDSAGLERNGTGAGGASGLCGNTGKNIDNTCGQ